MSPEFFISKKQFLDKMVEDKFKPFEYIKKENEFPLQIGLIKVNTPKEGENQEYAVSVNIDLVLKVSFRMFSINKDDIDYFFSGIEYLFGTNNIKTNSNNVLTSNNGIVNTVAKINIFVKNTKNYKNAYKYIKKYCEWYSKIQKLDTVSQDYDISKRLILLPAFNIEYNFRNTLKYNEICGLYNMYGLFTFGDKSYFNPKSSERELIYKDYSFVSVPNIDINKTIEDKDDNELKEFNNLLSNLLSKNNFKPIINSKNRKEDLKNNLKNIGNINYPIHKNMKILMFSTLKSADNSNNRYAIPIIFKKINIVLETNEDDKISLKLNISKPYTITVRNINSFLKAINNNSEDKWVYKYLNNDEISKQTEFIDLLFVKENELENILNIKEFDAFNKKWKAYLKKNKKNDNSKDRKQENENGEEIKISNDEPLEIDTEEENTDEDNGVIDEIKEVEE